MVVARRLAIKGVSYPRSIVHLLFPLTLLATLREFIIFEEDKCCRAKTIFIGMHTKGPFQRTLGPKISYGSLHESKDCLGPPC